MLCQPVNRANRSLFNGETEVRIVSRVTKLFAWAGEMVPKTFMRSGVGGPRTALGWKPKAHY